MVIFAVNSVGAGSPGKEEAKIGTAFLVEQVCSSVSNIEFGIASGQGGLFIFFIFGANVLGIPEVILLIALLVGIVVSEGGFNLFAGRSLFGLGEL